MKGLNRIEGSGKLRLLMVQKSGKPVRLVVYPIIYKVLYIPGGAGCLPSTVLGKVREVRLFQSKLETMILHKTEKKTLTEGKFEGPPNSGSFPYYSYKDPLKYGE